MALMPPDGSVDNEPFFSTAPPISAIPSEKLLEITMTLPKLNNDRFVPENGLRIFVQVPDSHVQKIIDVVLADDPLKYVD
jgi:hypothetical protein